MSFARFWQNVANKLSRTLVYSAMTLVRIVMLNLFQHLTLFEHYKVRP